MPRRATTFGNTADLVVGSCALISQAAAAGMIVSTLVYAHWSLDKDIDFHGSGSFEVNQMLAMVPVVFAAYFLRRGLFEGGVRHWSYLAFILATALAIYISLDWFRGPMHDLAMLSGNHGRWSCRELAADSVRQYYLRDDTAAWFIFGPALLTTALHWARAAMQGERR